MVDRVDVAGTEPRALGKLRSGSVGIVGDVVACVTNVGPTAGLGLSLAAFLGAAGLASPAAILIAGAAGLFLSLSWRRFNTWKPNAAPNVNWLRESVCPAAGFSGGVIYIAIGLLVVVINLVLLGSVVLNVIDSTASSKLVEWLIGAGLTVLVTAIAAAGIKGSIKFQTVLVYFEYAVVVIFSIWLLVANATGHISHSIPLSFSWVVPFANPGGLTPLLAGLVVAQFGIGGWDAPTYLGEEQRRARVDPGRAMIIGIIFVTIYLAFTVFVFQAVAPAGTLTSQANVLAYAVSLVWEPGKYLITIALVSGLVAASQALMNNSARTIYGLARRGAMPKAIGRINSKYATPWVATWIMGLVPVAIAGLYFLNEKTASIVDDLVGTIAYTQSALYFAVTLACIWFFRKEVVSTVKGFLLIALLPLLGAAVMLYAFQDSFPGAGSKVIIPTLIIVLGSALIGFILQAVNPPGGFFDTKLARREREEVGIVGADPIATDA